MKRIALAAVGLMLAVGQGSALAGVKTKQIE